MGVLSTETAFHTELMRPAYESLNAALLEITPRMRSPSVALYMNANGKKLPPGAEKSEVAHLLLRQLTSTVYWMDTIHAITEDGVHDFFECGPKKRLTCMMKHIDLEAYRSMKSVP